MKYVIEPSVTIITPSVGSDKLIDALTSVTNQTYQNLTHLLVYDGPDYSPLRYSHTRLKTCTLPFKSGEGGFYGHRIYAAFSQFATSDYVMFLDEDNWFEPDHVRSLVQTMIADQKNAFAHSLRKIYGPDKTYLIDDNCESLGKYPVYVSDTNYLVDTSSYIFNSNFIKQASWMWNWGWGADRRFYEAVKMHQHVCSGKHTLCYRLDGNPNSVTEDFFRKGNEIMLKKYNGSYPWITQ